MSVIWNVVSEIAAKEGIEPSEVDEPIGEVIDPEALDALCSTARDRRTVGSVQFVYSGYQVTVHFNGDVEVEEAVASQYDVASESRLAE